MEIKYKLYPYPVLSPYSNDYGDETFHAAINVVRDGYDLHIDFLANLTCQSLCDCIEQGTAKFVYHLECAQTAFRTVVQTNKFSEAYTLSNKVINGRLQISPFIVAVDDLKGFACPEFHEDYEGSTFDIEAGCVMAAGETLTVDILKEGTDDLASNPSIFSISKNPDESNKQMQVDMYQRKLIVKLPARAFNDYKILTNNPQARPMLNSLVIIPTLIYVLEELKAMSIQERRDLSDTLWYDSLSKSLLNHFNCDVESENFTNQNHFVLAQKLIDSSISDSFTFLTSSFDSLGGDEQ